MNFFNPKTGANPTWCIHYLVCIPTVLSAELVHSVYAAIMINFIFQFVFKIAAYANYFVFIGYQCIGEVYSFNKYLDNKKSSKLQNHRDNFRFLLLQTISVALKLHLSLRPQSKSLLFQYGSLPNISFLNLRFIVSTASRIDWCRFFCSKRISESF